MKPNTMWKLLFKTSQKRLVEIELDEANRALLQAHTNHEHWTAQVSYFQCKIKRLTKTWNDLNKEDSHESTKSHA